MYFIYSLLMGLAALLLLPYWLVQGLRHGKYLSNLGERLGFSFPGLAKLSTHSAGAIWIHAVSVGEALSSITLARRLKEAYPDRPLIISTTTNTGQALARERMPFADAVIYFPLDWAFCVRRALDAALPSVVLVLETEIWPNFLRESKRRKIPVLFVSGRISDRSFARYQSYLGVFGFFLRPFLRNALSNASAFLMQCEKDADRLRAGGLVTALMAKAETLPTIAPDKDERGTVLADAGAGLACRHGCLGARAAAAGGRADPGGARDARRGRLARRGARRPAARRMRGCLPRRHDPDRLPTVRHQDRHRAARGGVRRGGAADGLVGCPADPRQGTPTALAVGDRRDGGGG